MKFDCVAEKKRIASLICERFSGVYQTDSELSKEVHSELEKRLSLDTLNQLWLMIMTTDIK